MKKQLLKSALIAVASVGLMAGSGWATMTTSNYFTLTDYTTSTSGSVNSSIVGLSASIAADSFFSSSSNEFGFYFFDSSNAIQTYSVIDSNTNLDNSVQVNFIFSGGNWWVSLDNDITDPEDKQFSEIFGFYIKEGSSTYYTDETLNTPSSERITVDMVSSDTAKIYYTTDNSYGSTTQGNPLDLTITTYDVVPAAVPEPATMLLFGTGIMSLACFARRRK